MSQGSKYIIDNTSFDDRLSIITELLRSLTPPPSPQEEYTKSYIPTWIYILISLLIIIVAALIVYIVYKHRKTITYVAKSPTYTIDGIKQFLTERKQKRDRALNFKF